MEKAEHTCKIILLGDARNLNNCLDVGKTSIIRRLIHDSFNPKGKTTLNIELEKKTFNLDTGIINLDIWDTVSIR